MKHIALESFFADMKEHTSRIDEMIEACVTSSPLRKENKIIMATYVNIECKRMSKKPTESSNSYQDEGTILDNSVTSSTVPTDVNNNVINKSI